MKKNLLIALTSLAVASSSMGAVTISLTGNPTSGPAFFNPSTVVLDGSLIRIGTFNAAPATNSTFEALAAGFHEFARTTMGNASNVNTGHVVRQNIAGDTEPGNPNAANSPDADSFFIGKNVYIWVYDSATADPSKPQGVYSTSLLFADQPTAVSTSMTGYTTAYGQFAPPLNGGPVTNVVLNGGLVTRFNLAAPVPEPTVTVLGGLIAMLGLARRRR
jgi:hypothetical protein